MQYPTKKRYMYGPEYPIQEIFQEGRKMGVKDTEITFKCVKCKKYCIPLQSMDGFRSKCCGMKVNREAKFIR